MPEYLVMEIQLPGIVSWELAGCMHLSCLHFSVLEVISSHLPGGGGGQTGAEDQA